MARLRHQNSRCTIKYTEYIINIDNTDILTVLRIIVIVGRAVITFYHSVCNCAHNSLGHLWSIVYTTVVADVEMKVSGPCIYANNNSPVIKLTQLRLSLSLIFIQYIWYSMPPQYNLWCNEQALSIYLFLCLSSIKLKWISTSIQFSTAFSMCHEGNGPNLCLQDSMATEFN